MTYVSWEQTPEDHVEKYERLVQAYTDSLREAKAALHDAKKLAYRFAEEPRSGTMLKVYKNYGGSGYTYLFVNERGNWYSTGRTGNIAKSPLTWAQVRAFIGDNRCWILTVREEVPPKGA